MTRSIFTRGADWPSNVQVAPTFDSNITYDPSKPQGGLNWQHYQHQCFPWLSRVDESNVTLQDNRDFLMSAPDENGVEKPVRVTPSPPQLQISINNEMSSIVWRCDWATYGLPDLVRVVREDGIDFIRFEAHLAPLSQADNFTTLRDSFKVKAVDAQNKTVTIRGKKYYRKRGSTAVTSLGAPQYEIGNHWGFQRYMRDQLTSDAERSLDEFKVHEYNYAFAHWNGSTYRYSQVLDNPVKDHVAISWSAIRSQINRTDTDGNYTLVNATVDSVQGTLQIERPNSTEILDISLLKVANQDLLDELAAMPSSISQSVQFLTSKITDIESREVEPSEHRFQFQTFPTGIQVGDTLTMVRRLPYVTTMLSSLGNFSQKGGVFDFRMRFDRKKRQFSAAFLWTNYLESAIRQYLQYLKEMEIDVKEFPGATTPFMNTHRPQANRDPSNFGMYDYARNNGRDPVMGHPEWTENGKQQHQILIPIDSPEYVDSAEWHDVRVAICLKDNPLGFPENSVVWYERTAGGTFKFTGGCILSPEAHNNILDNLLFFLCNPVDGDFVADMEFFAPGQAATDEALPIKFDIAHIKIGQFSGFEPGGAGLPDINGQYPNGMRPTPSDETGNSGTPVVGVPVPGRERQAIVSGYIEEATRDDGGKLLIPELS